MILSQIYLMCYSQAEYQLVYKSRIAAGIGIKGRLTQHISGILAAMLAITAGGIMGLPNLRHGRLSPLAEKRVGLALTVSSSRQARHISRLPDGGKHIPPWLSKSF